MTPKPKNKRWKPSFTESLQQKKAKEDAEYLARTQARTAGIKRRLTDQRRKDQYDKIMREFDEPEMRCEIAIVRHKERIKFLEEVLRENMNWRERQDEPLQLKPNILELQARILEMKDYVAERIKSGDKSGARQVEKPAARPSELTPEQISAIYDRARENIQLAFGGILELLARNVRNGLPIERARERLITLGASKHVVDAFNEVVIATGDRFSEGEKNILKLFLLHPDRLGPLLESIIENVP